jgi:hypothetical protein
VWAPLRTPTRHSHRGFCILAPSLPRYEHRLLTVAYGRWFYPADVFVAGEVLEELVACEPALEQDLRWGVYGGMRYVHVLHKRRTWRCCGWCWGQRRRGRW